MCTHGPSTAVFAGVISVIGGMAVAGPPPAPEGFRWIANDRLSDEFNGRVLDGTKWYDYHPTWKGRPPAMFLPSTVSVTNGCLQIRNAMLPDPVVVGKSAYTIAGGAVVSREEEALYGYYEARIKASRISMSSTFWFMNGGVPDADGTRISQELDVVELVGRRKTGGDHMNVMKANSHYWVRRKGQDPEKASAGGSCRLAPPAGEAFHVYGCWWVDARHARFYLDDAYAFTIRFNTRYAAAPFDRPMRMVMVTETYDWETPPTAGELGDDRINTTYYDWVRAWRLVPE